MTRVLFCIAPSTILARLKSFPTSDSVIKLYAGNQTYYLGVIGQYPVCIVKTTMMGTLKRDASFSTVTEAINIFRLRIVIMPGIAFGRDEEKQNIGDILVCETLSQYETVKEDTNEGVITRGHSVPASSLLLNRFSQDKYWYCGDTNKQINIERCEILSGEKLVNDKLTKSALFKRFKNAKGGEMEGNGVYAACDKNKIDWIICKSICDWGDGKKEDVWQRMAANNSVGFVEHILLNKTAFDELDVNSVSTYDFDSIFNNERPNYKNILGFDIVRIIYPKQNIESHPAISIPKERIYYEYLEVYIVANIKIGYLFFAKNINQERAIQHFIKNHKHDNSSLVVCTPRVKSTVSGKDDYRLGSLESKFKPYASAIRSNKIQFSYIEDLVWEHCLSKDATSLNYEIPDEKYFIDQEVVSLDQGDISTETKSLSYFNTALKNELKTKPIIAVLGGAGVGKTTLCDQLVKFISHQKMKKAIYISSGDIEVNEGTGDVQNITDLYRLLYEGSIDDSEQLLDHANLEVNISCGNIIVIIDGLDEIEAKLKDRFIFSSFIQDAVNLNESYNNCTIIVTSRDYYKSKYANSAHIELLTLFGFDDGLAQKYFLKRLSPNSVDKASKQLDGLKISDGGYYPPVILSLVCDILESEQEIQDKTQLSESVTSKYLFSEKSFDALIIKLIDREIRRQSLSMTVDDVLEVLFDIASCEKGEILKTDLDPHLEMYKSENIDNIYSSFYVNPLLRTSHNNENVGFRYDNLLLILRSRYFNYCIANNLNNISFIKSALMKFYDGSGDLMIDILSNNSHSENIVISATTKLMDKVTKERDEYLSKRDRRELDKNKKYISALLYYYFGCYPELTRTERTERIKTIYQNNVRYLYIYGEFYALDFKEVKVTECGFYDYDKFEKSAFPINKKVFFDAEFKGIAPKANLGANMDLFDDKCRINNRLKHAIVQGEENKDDFIHLIKSDFVTVLNVLYRNRMFVKKSKNIFRNKKGKLYPKLSVEDYLSFLLENGVFGREKSHGSSSEYHYYVADEYRDDVRYLLTNNNFKLKLKKVFNLFLHKKFSIENKT